MIPRATLPYANSAETPTLSDREFQIIRDLVYQTLGIDLPPIKRTLVVNRLSRRLRERACAGFSDYVNLLTSGKNPEELQLALDLLTTNETYFWREARHFELLQQFVDAAPPTQSWRIWSAACSSGDEAYSIAMLMSRLHKPGSWELLASDVSQRMLEQARAAIYPLLHARDLPVDLLHRFCRRGIGEQEGSFRVMRELRERIRLERINLQDPLPDVGYFDVIFLRNVMIYFDAATKRAVLTRVLERLRPGGWLMVGHAESLHGLVDGMRMVEPACYQKPQ